MIREEGCRTFGFVGDHRHCRSFYERFCGMTGALFFAGFPLDLQYSILEDDSLPYEAPQLLEALKKLPSMPDCFVAANDSIALALISALKAMKLHVPKDVKVVGFDNTPETKFSSPPLTSFNVNKIALGKRIITILLDRINDPTQANQIIHIATKVVIRSST